MRAAVAFRHQIVLAPVRRAAFTLIELLTIIVFMGLILVITAPRLSRTSRDIKVRSAAVDLSARLALARQAAISHGGESVLHYAGEKVWVTVDSSGTQLLLRDTLFLAQRYGVTVAASMDTIRYNTRGFARLGSSQTFALTKAGTTQTVCVTAGGLVLSRGCTL
jgi:Tfp pilus assembly protein FimT